jgi:hypothetical protein
MMADRDCYVCRKTRPEADFPNHVEPVEFSTPQRGAGGLEQRDMLKVGGFRVWVCKDCWSN